MKKKKCKNQQYRQIFKESIVFRVEKTKQDIQSKQLERNVIRWMNVQEGPNLTFKSTFPFDNWKW